MSKRLQVVVDEQELAEFQDAARRARMSLSEWARQALRAAERGRSGASPDERIAAIRRATSHTFPAPDIDEMLAEIESGYLTGP